MTDDGAGDAPEPAERVGAALARILDQAARDLIARGDDGVELTLDRIVRGAIRTVPHVEQAGISLVERGARVQSTAPSNPLVRELDELQTALREGPCLDAIWCERRTVVDDMAAAHDRWPGWAVAAHERGVGSLMAFQLFATAGSAGALNLYATRPHVFDDDTADTGALFAAQAA
ncbi:MAG TPA: GAF domain-containing protein, partial [Actinomycetospora sp.]|nr:GAF domain-containing protein [Actinomycetospora sp.]